MISLFSPKENAMLLACLRSSLRRDKLTMGIIFLITVIVIGLFWSFASGKTTQQILEYMQYFLLSLQGIVLLFGASSLCNMVAKERSSGTLEFHRVTPQDRLAQVIGLLVGSSALYLFMALLLSVIIVTLSLGLPIDTLEMVLLQTSTFLYLLFIYSILLVTMLIVGQNSFLNKHNHSSYTFLVVVSALIISYFSMFTHSKEYSSLTYTLFNFGYVRSTMVISETMNYRHIYPRPDVFYAFLLQAIFHIPLILLAISICIRKLNYPNRSALSKYHAHVLCAIVFLMYLVDMYFVSASSNKDHTMLSYTGLLILFMGLFFVVAVTPKRLTFLKQIILENKEGKSSFWQRFIADGSSNLYFLVTYLFLVCVFIVSAYLLSSGHKQIARYNPITGKYLFGMAGISILQLLCFSALYEIYTLSRMSLRRQYTILSILVVVWAALPIIGMITATSSMTDSFIFVFASPFLALLFTTEFNDVKPLETLDMLFLWSCLLYVPLTIGAVSWAAWFRRSMKNQEISQR